MENILLKEAIIMANSNNMCRLCLSANGITEPICYDQRDQFLLQKIYECTTLQIAPLNGIPSSLCAICKARLDEFYQFRWQCIKNDEIIRRIADNFQKQSTEPNAIIAITAASAGPSQNPKQEIIESQHPNGELQISPVDGGGSSSEYTASENRRSDERHTPVAYQHPQHVEQPAYGVDHGHGQYAMGPTLAPNPVPPSEFTPELKYSVPPLAPQQHQHHTYEFSDFRRKRGRPPKQKYDQYHHPIVKYGENSTESATTIKEGSDSSAHTTVTLNEPETILNYGEGSSRGTDYHQPGAGYDGWAPQPKIKLEQLDQGQHQERYDEEMSPLDVPVYHARDKYMKLPGSSATEALMSPDGFVKRSRGRPPREGGCPNQDRTEYRFQCQFCDARFKAAINLKLHTNTHTGERPYKCQLCDKSFAHPSNLSVHTKLHSQERIKREGHNPSEKKFQCPYCHTLFALAFQLKIHINTHTGQKPYVCKNCGKGFAQPSNLHVHVKKHCHKRLEFDGQQQRQQVPLHHQPLPAVAPEHPQQQQQHYQQIQMPHQHHPALSIVPVPSHSHSPEGNQHTPVPIEHQQQPTPHHSPPVSAATQAHSLNMPPAMLT